MIIRTIKFEITRLQFEAFCSWITLYAKNVPDMIAAKADRIPMHHIMLHDFAYQKITASHLQSWLGKSYERYYAYQLPLAMALLIHRQLISSESWSQDNKLNQFHAQLHRGLQRIFSDEMLKPPAQLQPYDR